MPRKYRPPAKRRAARRTTVPYGFDPAPEHDENVDSAESPPVLPAEEPVITKAEPTRAAHVATARHLTRDYSYVRAEVIRIALVAGFLIISLVITSILRG